MRITIILAIGAWALLLMVMGFARDVFAHPADDACPPGVTVSFGCQVRAPHLGLTNEAFFTKHKQYWHCRRTLENTLKSYEQCIGAVNFRHSQIGRAPVFGEPGCRTYHEVIPATPIIEKPLDFANADAQIAACQANLCWTHVNACWSYLGTID